MVTADELAEPDLGQAGGPAGCAEALSDLPAAGGSPGGRGIEWHPAKLS